MKIAIYGAQAIALGTYNSIRELYPDYDVICFLVTSFSDGIDAKTVCGLPVIELNLFSKELSAEEKNNITVFVATPENVMDAIEDSLQKEGFNHSERIDSIKWAKLQEEFFRRTGKINNLHDYNFNVQGADIEVYQAKFHKDQQLKTEYSFADYFIPIQVGAAKTDVKISKVIDCEGDNISEKNGDYSELTALYWIWKNRLNDNKYYGLAHYRRILDLDGTDLKRLLFNDIDVILPYPMPYEPNIEKHHKRYLYSEEWSAVLRALDELQPEYARASEEIFKQEYMYNYNIVIAKRDVLKEYCEWLFPLLFRVEEIVNSKGDRVPNRYIGYIGENLETLYFMHNANKFKIAHAGCRFLV